MLKTSLILSRFFRIFMFFRLPMFLSFIGPSLCLSMFSNILTSIGEFLPSMSHVLSEYSQFLPHIILHQNVCFVFVYIVGYVKWECWVTWLVKYMSSSCMVTTYSEASLNISKIYGITCIKYEFMGVHKHKKKKLSSWTP